MLPDVRSENISLPDQPKMLPAGLCKTFSSIIAQCSAVNNHWTGLLEWTTGMDYWTDLFCAKNHFYGL